MSYRLSASLLWVLLWCFHGEVRTATSLPPDKQENDDSSPPPKAVLDLEGEFKLASEPLFSVDQETAIRLFRTNHVRDLIISGGGRQKYYHENMTQAYRQIWNNQCDNVPEAHCPNENSSDDSRNATLLVTELEVRFPSLQLSVVTKSLTGSVLLESSDGLPMYEYNLLGQKQVASGFPLSVRLFRQMTGNKNVTQSHFSSAAGASLSRVSLIQVSPDTDALAISFDCWLRLQYSFPAFLLRWLPKSKHRIEKMLIEAIVKAAKKEVTQGIEAARAFIMEEAAREYWPTNTIIHNEL